MPWRRSQAQASRRLNGATGGSAPRSRRGPRPRRAGSAAPPSSPVPRAAEPFQAIRTRSPTVAWRCGYGTTIAGVPLSRITDSTKPCGAAALVVDARRRAEDQQVGVDRLGDEAVTHRVADDFAPGAFRLALGEQVAQAGALVLVRQRLLRRWRAAPRRPSRRRRPGWRRPNAEQRRHPGAVAIGECVRERRGGRCSPASRRDGAGSSGSP